jgi:PAS domain S-box-containing protein
MDIEHSKQDLLAFLPGSGEMGERICAFNWSKTPMGPITDWPQSLKTMVRAMLSSRYAMWLGWGPELTFFYNDAYAQMTLGSKHPWALGHPAREVWSEIWDDIGPRAESVLRTGKATWDEKLLLFLKRRGFPEETYHTFSYSPVPNDAGSIGGMLCVVTEDTDQVIGERRLRILRELAAHTTDEVRSAEDACQTAAHILAGNPNDLPFILIYLLDDDGWQVKLAGLSGVNRDTPLSPTAINLEEQESPWPFLQVIEKGESVEVMDLHQRFGPLPGGARSDEPQQAIVLPLAKPGQARLAGLLVAGISPHRPLDQTYRGFLDLLSGQIAAAITNARAYEQERHRAEALAELDRAKTAFFSNISHEFRTPLTLMLGPVEDLLASDQTELPPTAKEQLELANRNGQRLLRLVNTLLEFSRIEANRVRAVYQPTDLAAFTAELASIFRSACERARLRLTVDCSKLSEPVYVDREMWEKIVLNLLSNAFKFTLAGEIAVVLRQVGAAAELRVRDTGTGITAEEMPQLFERFHRVKNTRGRTHEGSGIGLALVQEVVKLHGGSISVESVVNQGTTFIVTVPLGWSHLPSEHIKDDDTTAAVGAGIHSPFVEEALRWLPDDEQKRNNLRPRMEILEESWPIQNPPLETTEGDARPRVLIADDNADMRQYIVRLLAERYHVEEVSDGEAALAAVRERTPDLVLTDVMMPQLDGFGLLRELRADPRTSDLPVIMLSARAGEESRIEGMEAQADDYLVKPFSAKELLTRIRTHLQMAQLRRKASEALRQSKEQLEAALINSGTGTFRWSPHTGEFLEFDESLKRLFGFTPDEPVQVTEDFIARVHPEDVPDLVSAVDRCRQGADFEMEYRVVLPDGGIRWLYDRAKMMQDEQGEPSYLVGTCTDISQRKWAEQALQKERDLLRVTLASIGDAVITTDIEGHITSMNAVAESLTGWTSAEATDQPLDNVFRIVNEETRWTVENPATRALREGVIVGLANHTVLIRKDGTERPIDDSAAPIRDEQNQVVGCVLVFRDITERKQAEMGEREREQHFRMLVEQVKDYAIFMIDPQGRATSWNEGVKQVLGFEEADFLGKDIMTISIPEDVQNGTAKRELDKAAATGSANHDRWMVRKDGSQFFATGITTALHNETGKLVGFMKVMRDQTKQKHLERDLQQVAATLSEANRRKTEFLATLGHELRNPLAPIRTGLELMGMMADDPARLEEIRSMMERQVQQLVRLTDDLLDVSRITQGKLQLRKCQVALSDVIQSAVEASLPFIEEAGHKLVITTPPQPIFLDADPNRLAQVFSNLLSNSSKYTPEGGRIWLTAKRQESDVVVTVRDSGIGIPANMQANIFEMFTQIERPLEKGYQGLGIGLTLVKQLVEMHSGKVKVHSKGEGQGSKFSVRLPLSAEPHTAKPQSAQDKAVGAKLRILIVDDNKAAADMLGMVVKILGNDICIAYNGTQGVEAAAEFRPNVILTDLGMPEMDGYEAARHIREQEWGKDIILVALTGWGQDGDRQRTKEAGFDHHLVKPAEPAILQKLFAGIEPDSI